MCSCESRSYLHEPLWELSQVRPSVEKIAKLYLSKLWLALNFFNVLTIWNYFYSFHSELSRNLLQALRWTLHMWGHMSAEGKHITRYMMWVHNYWSKCVQTFKKKLWIMNTAIIFSCYFFNIKFQLRAALKDFTRAIHLRPDVHHYYMYRVRILWYIKFR